MCPQLRERFIAASFYCEPEQIAAATQYGNTAVESLIQILEYFPDKLKVNDITPDQKKFVLAALNSVSRNIDSFLTLMPADQVRAAKDPSPNPILNPNPNPNPNPNLALMPADQVGAACTLHLAPCTLHPARALAPASAPGLPPRAHPLPLLSPGQGGQGSDRGGEPAQPGRAAGRRHAAQPPQGRRGVRRGARVLGGQRVVRAGTECVYRSTRF